MAEGQGDAGRQPAVVSGCRPTGATTSEAGGISPRQALPEHGRPDPAQIPAGRRCFGRNGSPKCSAQRRQTGSISAARGSQLRRFRRVAAAPARPAATARRLRAVAGRQPDVGRDRIRCPSAAAIDHDGNLRAEPAFKSCSLNAPCGSPASGRGSAISSGSSPASGRRLHRHAGSHAQCQAHRCRAASSDADRRQAADLQAAARGHLDDAVAMTERGFGQSDQGFGRQTASDRVEPHQQAVAGLHRRGQRRAGAAAPSARSCRHLAAPAPRRSAPRDRRRRCCGSGCQRPRRRAVGKALGDALSRGRVFAQHEGAHLASPR